MPAKVITVRPPLLTGTLLAAIIEKRKHVEFSDAPVLVGFVDTEMSDEPGLYSVVDEDTTREGFEPGRWLQLIGTRPGVPIPPDRGKSPRVGEDRIHPSAVKRLEIAAYDAWFSNRNGAMTIEQLLAILQPKNGKGERRTGQKTKKKPAKKPDDKGTTEVLCAIFDETAMVHHGEIVEPATRIRFTKDAVAIEHERPGLVAWLKDKEFGVGRW